MTGVGGAPPPKPTYLADGTGRDTYIRRDPVEQHGKQNYKAEPRLITRFGASGSELPRDRHSGHAGFHPGERAHVGGVCGMPERPANFIRRSDAPMPNVGHFTTMKELMQDAHVSTGQMPGRNHHISGYTGYQPRYPTADEPQSAKWVNLQLDREAMLRGLFARLDFNSDGVLTIDELKRLAGAGGLDMESPAIKEAFAAADYSGNVGGGGDGVLTVDEVIVSSLEQTASLDDQQFADWCIVWFDIASAALAPAGSASEVANEDVDGAMKAAMTAQ